MKFILNKRIKHCTKEMFRLIYLIAIALFIILAILLFKYKLVCSVTVAGEKVGYIENKNLLEERIQNEILNQNSKNVAFIDVPEVTNYQLTFVSNNTIIDDEAIFEKIKQESTITYKAYVVTIDEEQKAIVDTLEEAESIVKDIENEYGETVKFTTGIHEIYTQNVEESKTVAVATAKTEIAEELQTIEDSSVNGVYLAQKPISGTITSRFGNRESIRSHAHTGLDIAAPYGTKIKAASAGTVTFSGYKGSYGNLIIVSCGNGVEIYYGHCSKLYAKVGQKVEPGDVIAAVGSTGNSTGNHLHFEIRVNGNQVNPQKYIYN